MRIESACWRHLGPSGQWVIALADTEWGTFVGTHADGVFRFDASTRHWEALGLDHAIVSSIVFQSGATKRLLVGMMPFSDEQTAAAVYASEDRGQSWKVWDGGLAAGRGNRGWAFGLAMDPRNSERLYMSYFDQIARSVDGGRSWQLVFGEERGVGGGSYPAIAVSAIDGTIWAAGENSIFQGVLYRSRDAGNTWEFFWVDPRSGTNIREDNGVLSLAVDPRNSARLFAGMQSGFLARSEDAGATWQPVFRARDISAFLRGVAYWNDALYVASSENFRPPPSGDGGPLTDPGLYRSIDNGATWDTLAIPSAVRGGAQALAVDRQGRLLIGTRNSGAWSVEIPR